MACDPNDITTTDTKPSWFSSFTRWSCMCKVSTIEAAINIFGALTDIAAAIREYADAVVARGYAVSAQHFRIEGGTAVTNAQVISEILVRSCFNQKVVGFGASILTYPTSSGASQYDDVISVRLYDYTAGAYCSDTITLTNAQKQGNHTDDGNSIGPNITSGHRYGVKIVYTNTDGGAFTMPDLDVFILTEPTELTYTP
jgi:hypothetical protein